MFWLLIALLPIIGLLLGIFHPHSNTIIEFGNGSQFELLDEATSPDILFAGYPDTLAARPQGSGNDSDATNGPPTGLLTWRTQHPEWIDTETHVTLRSTGWRSTGWWIL